MVKKKAKKPPVPRIDKQLDASSIMQNEVAFALAIEGSALPEVADRYLKGVEELYPTVYAQIVEWDTAKCNAFVLKIGALETTIEEWFYTMFNR